MADADDTFVHTDQWIDVVENREEYEYFYDLPTEEALDSIVPNDIAKISNRVERFFVRVIEVRKDCIIGTVDNHLRGQYDYMFGDKISFEKRHIFTLTKAKERTKKKQMQKNTARMIKMLGIDPSKSSKEAMLFESIQNQ
jgi:hypothetical protein